MKRYALSAGVVWLLAAAALMVAACANVPRMDFSFRRLKQASWPVSSRNKEKPRQPERTPTPENVVPRLDPEWSPDDRGTSETRFESLAPLEA